MQKIHFPPVSVKVIYLGADSFSGTYNIDALARADMECTAEQHGRVIVLTNKKYGYTMEYAVIADYNCHTYLANRDWRRVHDIVERITQLRVARIIRQINNQ
jgi:hypothetical protein